ncbi:molybdopterin-dependent oxidoreductase [Nocardia sp. 348MFTsu5.1]|uniref:molybdopterin-containing oxidoreductase family protein n=1 Tax=Nocardia sp. 348MFTsu5.1 TaxID=1172185 RepID=UPI000373F118|nr:molybdopterin-dependent oxidoreductase [Nocardia sp. 348MFTsu5.1]
MTETKATFCRICEPNCPLTATLDDHGQLLELSPAHGHQSGGIACHKGLGFADVHNDPDRVNSPQRRTNAKTEPGKFEGTEWDSALKDIGARLRAILEEHGPNSIALFQGNPSAFDSSGLLTLGPFMEAVGTSIKFGGATQDMANKTTGAGLIYGSTSSFMIPDLENTDYLLCVGANPRVSRWTLMSAPQDNLDVVKRMVERGGKVRFVNPRRIESSMAETGPTVLIKPGSDVYFLAAILHEIDVLKGFDDELIQKHGKNFDGLIDFVSCYPAETVEAVTGVAAAEIKVIAGEIVAAPSAIVYISTGVNQSRQGLLAFWLAEMINFTTGNLGRVGGTFKPAGLNDYCPPIIGKKVIETTIGPLELPNPPGHSKLPATLIADLIESGDIKAIISWYGNPLLTVGGEVRVRAAMEKLDLMVAVDLYRNVTGEMADYVLPGTDWLERSDINLTPSSGMQPKPYVSYTEAVVEPMHERRDGWWILARIAQEMGVSSSLDTHPDATDPTFLFDAALAPKGLSVDELREQPFNTAMLAEAERDSLYEQCLQHPDHLIDCLPAALTDDGLIDRCVAIFDSMSAEPEGTLKMISLRTKYMQNSSLVNVPKFRRGRNRDNPLHMCEHDAASIGLFDGDPIRVWNEHGEIESHVYIDEDMRPGVVAMSHGYGTSRAGTMRIAAHKPGANCNVLMPTGIGSYEPLSFMSWISGVPVQVERA